MRASNIEEEKIQFFAAKITKITKKEMLASQSQTDA